MQQIPTIPRKATSVTNTRTVPVAASTGATQRALNELDLFDPAIRAIRALGIADRVTLTAGRLSWRPDRHSGQIDAHVDVHVAHDCEDGSSLTIVTRFSATDERAHERLLDAWPVLGPLAATLVERAARTIKRHAEEDRSETVETFHDDALAA